MSTLCPCNVGSAEHLRTPMPKSATRNWGGAGLRIFAKKEEDGCWSLRGSGVIM